MRIPSIGPLLALTAGLSSIPTVLAWGAAGHEIVATIAQIHLHPSALPRICAILNYTSPDPSEPLCHLAPIATWADRIRFRMRWSAPLHYIGAKDDWPRETCAFPGPSGWEGRSGVNVLGAVRNTTGILLEGEEAGVWEDELTNEALKFLVHFLGDMHMPLHLTGRDRGGNGDKVLFDGRQSNLHSVWDTLLIAKALRTVPQNYSRPLPIPRVEHALRGTIYDSYVRRIVWEGLLSRWSAQTSAWLDCPAQSNAAPSRTGVWQQVMSLWTGGGGGDVERESDDDVLCPYHWAQPIHTLNCALVWPKALDEPPYGHPRSSGYPHPLSDVPGCEGTLVDADDDDAAPRPPSHYLELDTPEYAGAIARGWVVEKLLAQAGVRLAGVLNWVFADEGFDSAWEGPRRGLWVVDTGL